MTKEEQIKVTKQLLAEYIQVMVGCHIKLKKAKSAVDELMNTLELLMSEKPITLITPQPFKKDDSFITPEPSPTPKQLSLAPMADPSNLYLAKNPYIKGIDGEHRKKCCRHRCNLGTPEVCCVVHSDHTQANSCFKLGCEFGHRYAPRPSSKKFKNKKKS
jgi:hypothetical protein